MPGSAEDFEEAWAQIVAELSADRSRDESDDRAGGRVDGSATDPAIEPATDPATDPAFDPVTDSADGSQRPGDAFSGRPEQAAPSGAAGPGAFLDTWGDEGHYQPPPPPDLPAGTPAKRLAWAGMLGGPATLLLSALTPWNPPPIVALGAGLATVAGFIALVWMLPESREDGWDDGARV